MPSSIPFPDSGFEILRSDDTYTRCEIKARWDSTRSPASHFRERSLRAQSRRLLQTVVEKYFFAEFSHTRRGPGGGAKFCSQSSKTSGFRDRCLRAQSRRLLQTVLAFCEHSLEGFCKLCSHFLDCARGVQTVLGISRLCSRSLECARGVQTVLGISRLCSRFLDCARVLQSVLAFSRLCSRFLDCARVFQTVLAITKTRAQSRNSL